MLPILLGSLQIGVDYEHNDIRKEHAGNSETCKAMCASSRGCHYFTYNLNSGACHLKSKLENFQLHKEAVSGAK